MPAATAPTDRVFVIERIGDRIAPDTIVGAKRAGLACLPNGRVKWGDINLGATTDRRELVEDMLEDSGVPIATLASGTSLRRQIRLRGIVTDAAFSLCAKNMLGHPTALSGTAKLVMEWRGETGDGMPMHHLSTIEKTFEGKDAASLGAIGRAMLEDATRDLAKWLKGGSPEDKTTQ